METQGDDRRIAVIIEDDADIRHLLETVLTQAGFEAIATANGADGVEAVRTRSPLVVTLDVSMPGMDGFETAKRIRAFSSAYIVMLTARNEEIDTLQGLEAGADDYITKPFRPRELRARIEAMLRRPRQTATDAGSPASGSASAATTAGTATTDQAITANDAAASGAIAGTGARPDGDWLEHNGLRVNPDMRLALLGRDGAEHELELTRTEFDLLAALVASRRRVRSKSDLALLLRGESYVTDHYVSDADKRAVEVHMGNLRRKLGDSITSPRWLETVRGVGYRLAAPSER
ncbi:response regulator transcription factor [Glaciibacter superstes]|uniref:response regulator transcription factor n=1 Tax=Glaciibacter superstes TaxID=501023 RepID=UPI0003B5662D|nr:response regulator transcription factor [Glaciibacter superstes]